MEKSERKYLQKLIREDVASELCDLAARLRGEESVHGGVSDSGSQSILRRLASQMELCERLEHLAVVSKERCDV